MNFFKFHDSESISQRYIFGKIVDMKKLKRKICSTFRRNLNNRVYDIGERMYQVYRLERCRSLIRDSIIVLDVGLKNVNNDLILYEL